MKLLITAGLFLIGFTTSHKKSRPFTGGIYRVESYFLVILSKDKIGYDPESVFLNPG